MPCYSPIRAWRGPLASTGKRPLVFKRPPSANGRSATVYGGEGEEVNVPCGQCIGCRLETSRQWALRCVNEKSLWDENCFITLTFDSQYLPLDGSVSVRDSQLFMKRLRKVAKRSGIRFFLCGEYGESKDDCSCGATKRPHKALGRPHYHAILFNFDFSDKKYFRSNSRGDKLYRSSTLEKVWPFGNSLIGEVTFESAAYVARYVVKKINGEFKDLHYLHRSSGVLRAGEFIVMSRGCKSLRTGGIGYGWYKRFRSDVYPHDYCVSRGLRLRPPKYYDRLYDVDEPRFFAQLKKKRVDNAKKFINDNDSFRLAVKEEVKRAQIRSLSRNSEVGHDD